MTATAAIKTQDAWEGKIILDWDDTLEERVDEGRREQTLV